MIGFLNAVKYKKGIISTVNLIEFLLTFYCLENILLFVKSLIYQNVNGNPLLLVFFICNLTITQYNNTFNSITGVIRISKL